MQTRERKKLKQQKDKTPRRTVKKTQIDKEKLHIQNFKIYLIVGCISYVYGTFAYLQFAHLRQISPRMTIDDAIYTALARVFFRPFDIFPINGESLFNWFLLSILVAAGGYLLHISRKLKKHDNPETVNGEAHLMNVKELKEYNMNFSAPLGREENDGPNNMIISKDIRLAIDNRGTRRNCNILVIGGSGAGKSRFFASPNILQYNCNFVVTDPSGELLRDYGKALEDNGYEVLVFNLTDAYRSNKYNPFHYIKDEKDVFILVNTLIKNTSPSEGKGGDPFWEKSENLLISALILYLWHVYPEENQTFENVLKLLDMAEVDENDATAESPLDMLFKDLAKEDPDNLAVKQYAKFKKAAGKTLKSILISVAVRLQAFELSDIKYLTSTDDFEFEKFSDTKKALFVIIPTADDTFNFLVSLLYSQLFSSLYTYAETKAEFGWKASIDPYTPIRVEQASNSKESVIAKKKLERFVSEITQYGVDCKFDTKKKIYKAYTKKTKQLVCWRGTKEEIQKFLQQLKNIKIEPCGSKCPIHVRLILDEFANIGQIPSFDQKLATMRKYEISCSIILQALSQLKDIYKDKWNTIVSNCDTKLFLGCDDSETIEWLLKMLGKKTTVVENTSYQATGGGSTSYNRSSIDLLTIDQIAMMQDDECLVRIRGVRPYYGKKYELTQHPNYPYAKKTAGSFVIPVSKDIEKRQTGPLRLKRVAEAEAQQQRPDNDSNTPNGNNLNPVSASKNRSSNAAASVKHNIPVSTSPAPTAIQGQDNKESFSEAIKKRFRNNNKRKKNEAEKTKNLINLFNDEKEVVKTEEMLMESLGIPKDSVVDNIKEVVETAVFLETVPENVTFAMTN